VKTPDGQTLAVPPDWELLPPGDAALSRRVKAEGPCWTVEEKRGRRVFSRGIWAPRERIERLREALVVERADPAYQKKLESGRRRRQRQERAYAEDFEAAVLRYLDFCDAHRELSRRMARAIAVHAVPVGSGTVARTRRIPIEKRAEAATIAWMRHQTTAYDDLSIPRVKGMRREVRRALAQRSKALLHAYRQGTAPSASGACPLRRALREAGSGEDGNATETASKASRPRA
jgi:hypothetical protein